MPALCSPTGARLRRPFSVALGAVLLVLVTAIAGRAGGKARLCPVRDHPVSRMGHGHTSMAAAAEAGRVAGAASRRLRFGGRAMARKPAGIVRPGPGSLMAGDTEALAMAGPAFRRLCPLVRVYPVFAGVADRRRAPVAGGALAFLMALQAHLVLCPSGLVMPVQPVGGVHQLAVAGVAEALLVTDLAVLGLLAVPAWNSSQRCRCESGLRLRWQL